MSDNWLLRRLADYADETAFVWQTGACTYRGLLDKAASWQAILAQQGVRRGECVALVGDFSQSTISLLLALIWRGNTAVPLSPVVVGENPRSMEIVHAACGFEFDDADRWKFCRYATRPDHPLLREMRESGEPGLVLLSSGSTGQTKASLLGFSRLVAKYRKRRKGYRTLAFLLLDHIGGINTLFRILTSGGTIVGVAERSTGVVCQAIEEHRVELLPTTPTFLRMLLISEAYQKYDLSSLKVVSYGTEPMPASTLEALHRLLPWVKFKQTYGLTEVGILPTRSERCDSLWMEMRGDGYETEIRHGVLWIRTESAMRGYLNAPSPFDEHGWFNTGDLVEQKGNLFRILGRESEIINVGGQKVLPAEVENVISQVQNVKNVTVAGKRNPVVGHVVVARVELCEAEDPRRVERRIGDFCKSRLAPFKRPVIVEVVGGRLHNHRFKTLRKRHPGRTATTQ